jgi:DNA replication and repair protein RecF
MSLVVFNIANFRNFSKAELNFSNGCNLIYGKNGSGKTSLLEAIYYLILGRSFRSHLLRRIIKYGTGNFSLFGKIYEENQGIGVGVTKSINTEKQIKIAGKNVQSHIEITRLLPIQLLTHNSYLILSGSSKARRQFIDWGMFHVKHSFLDGWRKVERIVEQRNAAIRNRSSIDCIQVWDKELAEAGTELHQDRLGYVQTFIPIAQEVLKKLSCDFAVDIAYNAGWDTKKDLYSTITDTIKTDLALGYTSIGPQRGDLQITIGKVPAKDALSRGQQKLLLYGLQIAQGIILEQLTAKRCIYLVDDLLAELDNQKCKLIAEILLGLPKTQLFVTGLTQKDITKVFNAKGCCSTKAVFNVEELG